MTDRELMQQAYDALLNFESDISDAMFAALTTLRARLAQPEPEPVAWAVVDGDKIEHVSYTRADSESWLRYVATRKLVSLYTAPPQREWQSLTDEEKSEIYNRNYNLYAHDMHIGDFFLIQQAIEAKLREKNT